MTRYWKCRKCGRQNARRKPNCVWADCTGKRPKPRRPKHAVALDLPYEHYVELNGGEHCGICGAVQKEGGKRLHRDHCHRSGKPRGILCFRDNSALRPYMTAEWLRAALAYVERTEDAA